MKKTMVVWTMFIFILVGGLTFIGYTLTNKNKDYYQMEKKLEEAAKEYYSYYSEKLPSKETTIKSDELIKEGFLKDLKIKKEKCTGFVKLSKNLINYEYTGYLKCNEYTTKNYKKEENV